MKLKTKLLISFIAIGLIPFLIASLTAYFMSSTALQKEATELLSLVKDSRYDQITNYFERNLYDANVIAKTQLLQQIFKNYTDDGKNGKLNAKVTEQYLKEFDDLFFNRLNMKERDFADLMLIDKNGKIIYNYAKDNELGRIVTDGSEANSIINEAYQDGLKELTLNDFKWYEDQKKPISFITLPVYKDKELLGVLALEMSIDSISSIMQDPVGLGETGETYLVGPDYLLRSNLRLDKDLTVAYSFEKNYKIELNAVKEAFEGKEGEMVLKDIKGVESLTTYKPFKVLGLNWALIAEVDTVEAFSSVNQFGFIMLIVGFVLTVLIAVYGIWNSSTLTKQLKKIVDSVTNVSDRVSSSSQELLSIAESSSQMSQQVAETIEQLSIGAQNQAKDVSDSAEKIIEIARISNDTVQKIENGQNDVSKTIIQITDIKNTTENLANQINKLGGLAKEIGKIVELITNIASQTNLLALNAAIESARAGEHGKGFAVVAEEVKNLADESASAARQIKDMIEQVQIEAQLAVNSTKTTVVMVEEGVKSVNNVKNIFKTIETSSKESETKTCIVSQAMENISAIVEETSASTEEISASTEEQNSSMEELSSNATMLTDLTSELYQSVDVLNKMI